MLTQASAHVGGTRVHTRVEDVCGVCWVVGVTMYVHVCGVCVCLARDRCSWHKQEGFLLQTKASNSALRLPRGHGQGRASHSLHSRGEMTTTPGAHSGEGESAQSGSKPPPGPMHFPAFPCISPAFPCIPLHFPKLALSVTAKYLTRTSVAITSL